MIPQPLEDLMKTMSKIPGFGRRSAQRAALHLLTHKEHLHKLQADLATVLRETKTCQTCQSIALNDPCHICCDTKRQTATLCVVEEVADLWAIERSGAYQGQYHVLGGLLSAIDGIGPEDIGLPKIISRIEASQGAITEVILALSASIDGQTTAHLIAAKLKAMGVDVTTLAKGLPMGAEIDYMDEGTLSFALQGRRII